MNAETTGDDPSPLIKAHPAWEAFELDVASLAATYDGTALVTHNVRREGVISFRARQIDALVIGKVGFSDVEVIVECKRNTTSVLGIGVVDEFVGKLLDLGVGHGVLCAWGGFGAGAQSRAANAYNPRIELRNLQDLERLTSWSNIADQFFGVSCPTANCWGETTFTEWPDGRGGTISAGICDSCGTFIVECVECGSVVALQSGDVECFGCDARFVTIRTPDSGDVTSIVVFSSTLPPLN